MLWFFMLMMWQTPDKPPVDTATMPAEAQAEAADEADDQETAASAPDLEAFREAEQAWREARAESMRAETSWLNLVGLFWLEDGPNPFGSDPSLRFALPPHSTVARAGTFYLEDGRVRYDMNRGQRAVIDGETRNQGVLEEGQVLAHNHLRMFVIERDGRLAVRARDLRLDKFLDFNGLEFYRIKPEYAIEAEYIAYDEPKELDITTVISSQIQLIVPGEFRFQLHGKQLTLIPTVESVDDEEYFIMFQDETSGETTYSGGRFMYVDKPVDGKAVLNFNRAYNPPCAYTPYATCPLPPAQNWLAVPVEAGERKYPDAYGY